MVLSDVLVSTQLLSNDGTADDAPVEKVTLNFAKVEQTVDGVVGRLDIR
jgi:type VI protein secretion system component Hcp